MGLIQQEVWGCVQSDKVEGDGNESAEARTEQIRKESLALTFIILSLSENV